MYSDNVARKWKRNALPQLRPSLRLHTLKWLLAIALVFPVVQGCQTVVGDAWAGYEIQGLLVDAITGNPVPATLVSVRLRNDHWSSAESGGVHSSESGDFWIPLATDSKSSSAPEWQIWLGLAAPIVLAEPPLATDVTVVLQELSKQIAIPIDPAMVSEVDKHMRIIDLGTIPVDMQ